MSRFVIVSLFVIAFLFNACSTRGKGVYSPEVQNETQEIDNKKYSHPTMRPYVVRGIRYHPTVVSVGNVFKGNASWYGPDFHGKLTSNGEIYNMYQMTAAHKTLPMNTIVKVTNLTNGLSTVVRINDRGPFIATRIIDLSKSAAKEIDMIGIGTAPVTLEVLGFKTKGTKNIPTNKELKENPQEQEMTNFAIQIASFSKIEGALKVQKLYDNTNGYRTIIKDVESDAGRSFKVWLKGFKSEDEARDYKENSVFKDAFIVKED